jgi:CubicO group peptidase (beta-lactamase class C family)
MNLKTTLRLSYGILLTLLLLSACAHSPKPKTEAPKPQTIEELRKAIAAVLAKDRVPGVGIALVSRDRVIWAGGVGKADLAANRDVAADTMFRIGSITKGFVALSLLKLQEQGKVDLNAKVSDLAPEVGIANRWKATDPVRIVNLLEHTAGFDDFSLAEFYDFNEGPEVPLLKTLKTFPEPQHVRWRPDTLQSYSNVDYAVAGYIVEKLTHEPCEDYIAQNILRPLGMTHSDMRLTPEVRAALAQGYEGTWPVPYYPILLRPAGDMKSSPAEMARFVRMMLNRGTLDGVEIVSAASILRMETPETGLAARAGLRNGYGLGNYTAIGRAIVTHGHDGGLDGFLSQYACMPDQGLGYFFSINSSTSGAAFKAIGDLLFDFVTRGVKVPPKPAAKPLDSNIRQAAGFYVFASPRNEKFRFLTLLTLDGWTFIKNGKLYREGLIPGSREKLIYLGNNQFRTEKESGAEGVYCTDQEGARYGCGLLSCFRKTSPIWPVTRFSLAIATLLAMATSILFAFVWIPRKLLGRMRGARHLSVRLIPLLAVAAFALMWLVVYPLPQAIVLATENVRTVAFFLMSLMFPILSLAALAFALRSLSWTMNRAVKSHSLVVAIACTVATVYLGYWGVIGFRFWAPW